jgi:hypothetical protein
MRGVQRGMRWGGQVRGAWRGTRFGGELARGLGDGNMQIGEESNLHKDGHEYASISSALVEVSALLHNRYMFLNWV